MTMKTLDVRITYDSRLHLDKNIVYNLMSDSLQGEQEQEWLESVSDLVDPPATHVPADQLIYIQAYAASLSRGWEATVCRDDARKAVSEFRADFDL
jgi:hypothetical protein